MIRVARWLAVVVNAAASLGCILLAMWAPDRAATAVAGAGVLFFALAGAAFFMLLRLEIGVATRKRADR